jgi:hypothetical protein
MATDEARANERVGEVARGLVSEQIASGQSVAVFCRDRGLRDWQFTNLPGSPIGQLANWLPDQWKLSHAA